jgi:hypothetical protein
VKSSSVKKLCLVAVILTASLATAQEIDVDKIILTVPKFDPAGKSLGGPVTFKCDEFELRFSAKAKPVSLKRLSDGKELIFQGRPSEGFYLNSFKGRIPFTSLSKRKDGSYVAMTPNKTQRVIFTVENRGKYLTFRIKGLHGIPTTNNVTLHYEMICNHNVVRAFGLDYMTEDWGSFPVTWRWLWRRGPGIPRGAFAMYLKNSDADEDDKIINIWVNEKIPHPAIKGLWDENAARAWMKKWIETFSDTSVMWYTFPKSEKELYEMIPYLKIAGIKEVHLAPWSWADRTHHCRVNAKFFTGGRAGLRKYALEMARHGMRVTLHYNFCKIRFDDPVFVGTKPNDGLASWGKGTLLKDVDAKATTLYFRPGPRTQLPYAINPIYRECLPPALVFNNDFHYVRIGDEIIKVGRFENTESDVWVLRGCKRGLGSTLAAAHRKGNAARGLVVMYKFSFLPGTDSELFDTMTSELADLLNYCRISHIEYDGLNPCVWAMGEFAYRKWTGEAYAKIDHPITYMTGYGEARRWGHFEYRFNAVKKLRGKVLAPRGDIGARVRTWHLSRPSSTMDEAQFRMSQPAAFGNPRFPMMMAVHYPSKWKEYGKFKEMCKLVKDWKTASRKMTDAQRKRIRDTLHKPLQRGFQSDIVWRLRDEGDAWRIYPGKNPLTRRSGDVRRGTQGAEAGYVEPGQYIKSGQTLELENPYRAQAPKFVIRMMNAMDYKHAENIVLQPKIADVANPSEARVTGNSKSITIERRNSLGKTLDRKSQDSVMPVWHRRVDMRSHRGIGMWVTGDGSGPLVVLRLPHIRDYVVKLDFKGRKYFEIPNGEVFWAGADWGGPIRSAATAFNYHPNWFKLDFGEIPARKTARVTVEGIKALKDIPAALVNPVISIGRGKLSVQGTVKSDQILQYEGGKSATLYDRNWNKIADLPVKVDKYVMATGYHKVTVTGDQKNPQPWMFVRFITEGDDPIVIEK